MTVDERTKQVALLRSHMPGFKNFLSLKSSLMNIEREMRTKHVAPVTLIPFHFIRLKSGKGSARGLFHFDTLPCRRLTR